MGLEIAPLVALAALVAIWIVVVRDCVRALRPPRLMLQGRYAEARAAADRIARSWMRILPRVRSASLYTVAATLHLEGKLEASLDAVRTIDRRYLDRNLSYAVSSIEAASLVLLGRDLQRAATLLEGVRPIRHAPDDMLLLAHAKRGLGAVEEADALVERASAQNDAPAVQLGRVVLLEDRRQKEAIFHTLRGLYLLQSGRVDEARRDLEIAVGYPAPAFYVERARALLSPVASEAREEDAEGPSSLVPQVLAAGPRT